jgi:hypothetical protein
VGCSGCIVQAFARVRGHFPRCIAGGFINKPIRFCSLTLLRRADDKPSTPIHALHLKFDQKAANMCQRRLVPLFSGRSRNFTPVSPTFTTDGSGALFKQLNDYALTENVLPTPHMLVTSCRS